MGTTSADERLERLVETHGEEPVITAFHEAGHAWAHHQCDHPLAAVTLHPDLPSAVGMCMPPAGTRYDVGKAVLIAAAGPIAQAVQAYRLWPDEDEWEDHLVAAVLVGGGRSDAEQALGLLDDWTYVSRVRDDLLADWSGVQHLAVRLLRHGTVTGPDAVAELTRGGDRRRLMTRPQPLT